MLDVPVFRFDYGSEILQRSNVEYSICPVAICCWMLVHSSIAICWHGHKIATFYAPYQEPSLIVWQWVESWYHREIHSANVVYTFVQGLPFWKIIVSVMLNIIKLIGINGWRHVLYHLAVNLVVKYLALWVITHLISACIFKMVYHVALQCEGPVWLVVNYLSTIVPIYQPLLDRDPHVSHIRT